jgi:uncharacterized protein (TIRG00374 family)
LKKKLTSFLQFTAFIAAAGILLWLAFRNQDVDKLRESLNNANYWWILLSLVLGLISHVSRAIRWNMLIKPLGFSPRLINTFFAVMVGYFANLAFPRLGEVTKCGILRKYEDVPINKLLGTMIIERAADLVSLTILLIAVFIFEFALLKSYFLEQIAFPLQRGLSSNITTLIVAIIAGVLIVAGSVMLFKRFRHLPIFIKLRELIIGFVEGLKTIKSLNNFWTFLFHSLFIWLLYYSMTYVAFFAFGETEHLGLMAGLVVFVFGSIGMVMPLPGGLGSYHILVQNTLMLYNIGRAPAIAFATLVHAGQTFGIIILGFLSLLLLPIVNRKKHVTRSIDLDLEEDHSA